MELRWNWDGTGMELRWNCDGTAMELKMEPVPRGIVGNLASTTSSAFSLRMELDKIFRPKILCSQLKPSVHFDVDEAPFITE